MDIGKTIHDLRVSRGLTLEQVGDYVGVSKATVLKWESGKIKNMRRDKIVKLAEILGTEPGKLIGWGSGGSSARNTASDRSSPGLFQITPHEKAVIEAYRSHPALCSAVDRMLEVAPLSSEDEANARTVSAVVEALRAEEKESVPTR